MNDLTLISILSSRDRPGGKGFVPVRFRPFLNIESPINRIIGVQVIATICAAGMCLIFGLAAAYSTLLGGLVCVLPGYVAAKMVVANGVRQETLPTDTGWGPVVRSELMKLVLSIVLFIATFTLIKTLDVLFFFGAFIGLQLVYLVVPAVEANHLRRRVAGKKSG